MQSQYTERRSKHRGYGGFPMPHEIFGRLFARFFPNLHSRVTRTVTVPLTTTLTTHAGDVSSGGRFVPYITFDAIVGRNSAFPLLTNEQLEELGGVEYRALNALLFIIAAVSGIILTAKGRETDPCCQYHIGIQLGMFVIVAPYISQRRWASAFVPPALHQKLSPPWYVSPHLLYKCAAYLCASVQVFDLPGCVCIHEHGHVARRPVDGSVSEGVRHDLPLGVLNLGWQYLLCECDDTAL